MVGASWGPEPLDAEQRRDLLEIVEDRYKARSIIVTSHWGSLSSPRAVTAVATELHRLAVLRGLGELDDAALVALFDVGEPSEIVGEATAE